MKIREYRHRHTIEAIKYKDIESEFNGQDEFFIGGNRLIKDKFRGGFLVFIRDAALTIKDGDVLVINTYGDVEVITEKDLREFFEVVEQ